jgi:nicotinamidase-related amidase
VDVIVVVDMQVGLLNGAPKHDLQGVVDRINLLTAMVRRRSGKVVWIRHCGEAGSGFEPLTPGWAFLPKLCHQNDDIVIEKKLNDPFAGTPLQRTLASMNPASMRRSDQPFQMITMSSLSATVTP